MPLAIPEHVPVLNRSLSQMSEVCRLFPCRWMLTEAVAAVEAVLQGVAVQHQLTRSRQVVSLGDDPGVVSTDVSGPS